MRKMLGSDGGIPHRGGRILGRSSTASDVSNPLTRNLLSRNAKRGRQRNVPVPATGGRKKSLGLPGLTKGRRHKALGLIFNGTFWQK
jgi:hypothetical protein